MDRPCRTENYWRRARYGFVGVPMSDHGVNPLRSLLPTPERTHVGLTTYGAKDPNTKFPPIRHLKSRS